jgi:phosphoribosyl-ATP pyrophosphohydrolase
LDIVSRLYSVVLDRKASPSPDSYVCRLLANGEDRILQKLGEEAVEAILAAKSGSDEALVCELADLTFHASSSSAPAGFPPSE